MFLFRKYTVYGVITITDLSSLGSLWALSVLSQRCPRSPVAQHTAVVLGCPFVVALLRPASWHGLTFGRHTSSTGFQGTALKEGKCQILPCPEIPSCCITQNETLAEYKVLSSYNRICSHFFASHMWGLGKGFFYFQLENVKVFFFPLNTLRSFFVCHSVCVDLLFAIFSSSVPRMFLVIPPICFFFFSFCLFF